MRMRAILPRKVNRRLTDVNGRRRNRGYEGRMPDTTRVVIVGAAGRDFHDFNVVYRDDPRFEVVAFTAAQIPDIAGRRYPPALAGPRYPAGIPIVAEAELDGLCRRERIGLVVFAYSDVPHAHVMHLASHALAAGADFTLLGPDRTMLRAGVPVIAVSAVRTGCGKSQVARWIARRLRNRGLRVAVIRHPMPYGDLERQAVQRFATRDDLAAGRCTIEEREEYEPHIAAGNVVYAGVDYARIVGAAQAEADAIVWDGGNNDFPFVRPDLHVVLVDPLRPGHETGHHPGEAVLRMADVVLVAKANAAATADVARVARAAQQANPRAAIVRGGSPIRLDDPQAVRGRRVVVVEDGPSTTHGGMATAPATSPRSRAARRRSCTRARTPRRRSPRSTTSTRTSGRCCRRWATRRRSSRRSRDQSTRCRPRSSSRARRSISRRSCRSQSRWCGRGTSSPRSRRPASAARSTASSPAT
jgi:predicted GTPase